VEFRDLSYWKNWQPTMRASLCFVLRDGQILMIRKKRGLGAGKINGPGGRLELGESPLDAAIRETEEELCITPLNLSVRGELHFQFVDGLSLHCVVFTADGCLGEPKETDEAIPHWMEPSAIPYHDMWADDILWLPGMLEGRNFKGYFHFDEDQMLSHHVDWNSDAMGVAPSPLT
jgi:8-oxo-dGTP diphosphatase